jgi:aspartate racemase
MLAAMKTIGLLGGMSWESSREYYRLVNELVRARLGGLHSARCILYSVDFADIETLQTEGRWAEAAVVLGDAAAALERAGAELLVLCTNTMHKVAEPIEARIAIPLLHIADAAAHAIKARGCARVGLVGTRFTMEERFYASRLEERHGLGVLIPDADDRSTVNAIIYDELCRGQVLPASRARLCGIVDKLVARGAEGVALACTELPLLVGAGDVAAPLFDTTTLHAEEAVRRALIDLDQ